MRSEEPFYRPDTIRIVWNAKQYYSPFTVQITEELYGQYQLNCSKFQSRQMRELRRLRVEVTFRRFRQLAAWVFCGRIPLDPAVGSLRDPCGIQWGSCGIRGGSVWDPDGILRDPCGICVGSSGIHQSLPYHRISDKILPVMWFSYQI